jgi:hypothetical protein
MLGHWPLPAKLRIQVLRPIDVTDMDVDEAYDQVIGRMQAVLTDLQRERRVPVLG